MERFEIDGEKWVEMPYTDDRDEIYQRFKAGDYAILEIMDKGSLKRRIWFKRE